MLDPGIVRNRLKIFSARTNAQAFLKVQKEFGSFDAYLWDHVGGKPLINKVRAMGDVPVKTELSDRISRSEEHTSELQSLMRISYAVFCLKKKKHTEYKHTTNTKTVTHINDDQVCNN